MSERNRMMFNLVQTKERQHVILFSNEKLVFIQTNLRVLESMRTHDVIQELNPNEIDITRVPSLPSRLGIEIQYSFWYEEKA
jgi:hypothetical protein